MKSLQFTLIALAILALPISANAETGSAGGKLTREEIKEMVAGILNLQGLLCAKVVDINPLSQQHLFEVRCIEYRGGTGTIDYILDSRTMKAFER